MNWEHPEAVMRARIQGLVPTCYNCKHGANFPPPGWWCMERKKDPAPHVPAHQKIEINPEQTCEAWDEHT